MEEFCHDKRLPFHQRLLGRNFFSKKKEEEQSPVSRRRGTLVVAAISPRGRSSPRPIVSVGGVRILVATTGWGAVGILAVAATGGWWVRIINGWAGRARRGRRAVAAVTGVVIVTGWGATTVIVTTGAVATRGRWPTAVVAVRRRIATASTERWGRARPVAVVAGNLILGLLMDLIPYLTRYEWENVHQPGSERWLL